MKVTFWTLLLSFAIIPAIHSRVSTSGDVEQIESAILGYITNFFVNDYYKMEIHLHERLSKRGVNPDGNLSADYPQGSTEKVNGEKAGTTY